MSDLIYKETDWLSRKCDPHGGIPVFDKQGNRTIVSPYAKDNGKDSESQEKEIEDERR